MSSKIPAWQRMVAEGFAENLDGAERWILSGKVFLGLQRVQTAGQMLAPDATLTVRGFDHRYTSKGGLKLEGALADFHIQVKERICIDAGASTGGFTHCLVEHGAARVYAVDVGYGQLMGSLRNHPSVVNLERTNIDDALLRSLDPLPTLGTVDLSYLSLRKGIPAFDRVMHGQGELLCLVKPLFEIDDMAARRSGVVPENSYAPLLHALCTDVAAMGHGVCGVTHSPVTGNSGTLEFFLHVALQQPDRSGSSDDQTASIARAVARACALERFHKES
ncbi:MAG: TlyA family RNA methyltransferase [Clostridia bacterium]